MVTVCNATYFTIIISVIRGEEVIANNVTIQPENTRRIDCGDLNVEMISLCDYNCQYEESQHKFRPGSPVIIEDGEHTVTIKHEMDDHH